MTKVPGKIWNRKLLCTLIFLLLLFFIIRNLGDWLVRDDKPVKADLIFVLMGSMGDRPQHTIDLYKGGYAPKILLVTPEEKYRSTSPEKWINVPTDAELIKKIFVQNLIDSTVIEVIGGPAINTMDEGKELAGYCERNLGIKKVLVATSVFHSGRAYKILKKELKRRKLGVELVFPLNPYTKYDKERWWMTRQGIGTTFLEVLKTAWYLGWKAWSG